jgi:hypothetical protein
VTWTGRPPPRCNRLPVGWSDSTQHKGVQLACENALGASFWSRPHLERSLRLDADTTLSSACPAGDRTPNGSVGTAAVWSAAEFRDQAGAAVARWIVRVKVLVWSCRHHQRRGANFAARFISGARTSTSWLVVISIVSGAIGSRCEGGFSPPGDQ